MYYCYLYCSEKLPWNQILSNKIYLFCSEKLREIKYCLKSSTFLVLKRFTWNQICIAKIFYIIYSEKVREIIKYSSKSYTFLFWKNQVKSNKHCHNTLESMEFYYHDFMAQISSFFTNELYSKSVWRKNSVQNLPLHLILKNFVKSNTA